MWRSHALDGTDNMQLSSPSRRYIHEGKTSKVVTVSPRNLRKPGGNGATPALDDTKQGIAHREEQSVCEADPNRRDLEITLIWKNVVTLPQRDLALSRPSGSNPVIPRILDQMRHQKKREKKNSRRKNEAANLVNRRQKTSLCTCPPCRTTMQHQQCRSTSQQNRNEALLPHCLFGHKGRTVVKRTYSAVLDRVQEENHLHVEISS